MKLRKLDSRGTKRKPRWDKDASADFRVKEGCLRSTEVKARSRQEYKKNHESGKFASSLGPKGNMLRKNAKDILVQIFESDSQSTKMVKQGEHLPQ